ncbi:MAG: ABC transporter ATP-binding protein [Promethearchaeota archaeon]
MTIIECKNVDFKYNLNSDQNIIKSLSITFDMGHFYGILGPNGCGKTTLIKIIMGILQPLKGEVLIDNIPVRTQKPRELAKKIALVAQSYMGDFDFSVKEIIMMGRYPYIPLLSNPSKNDKEIVDKVVKQLQMEELINKKFFQLSGGEQQKVMIARALIQETNILLLDEPTAHLDIKYQIEFMNMFKKFVENNKLVIAVIHDINLASMFCDQLIFMNDGKIIAKGPVENTLTEENIRATFHISSIVKRNPITNSMYMTPLSVTLPNFPAQTHNIQKIENMSLSQESLNKKNSYRSYRVHIISGGGTGAQLINQIYKLNNLDISIGIINVLDDDYNVSVKLGLKIISEAPFSPISKENADELKYILKKTNILIVTEVPFGPGNIENLKCIENFDGEIIFLDRKLIENNLADESTILENFKNNFKNRDFTEGRAFELINKYCHKYNTKIFTKLDDLINYLKSL